MEGVGAWHQEEASASPGSPPSPQPPPPRVRRPCTGVSCSPGFTLAVAPGAPGATAAPAMGEEDYYLELCERPVHFEKANPVNCVFFDEANKQVRPSRTLLSRAAECAQPAVLSAPGLSRAPRLGVREPGLGPLFAFRRSTGVSDFLLCGRRDQAPPLPGLSSK